MLDFAALTADEQYEVSKLLAIKPKYLNPKVRAYLERNKAYISLTTSPLRLKKLPIVLNMLDLRYIHEIHINLPQRYRNKDKYMQKDIDFIKQLDSRIRVYRIPKDYGPLTKIIPTLQRVKNPKSIVISIDDDIAYPFNLITSLLHHSVTRPTMIFTGGFLGFGDYPNSNFNPKLWPKSHAGRQRRIAEGWCGIAYTKKLISATMIRDILTLNAMSTTCKLSDDLTISYVLAEEGIMVRQVPGTKEKLLPLEYGEGADALHKGSGVATTGVEDENMQKYHTCLNDIAGLSG